MHADLPRLIADESVTLEEVAAATGLSLAYCCGWDDSWHQAYDACELLAAPTADEARDYERGRADGDRAYYAAIDAGWRECYAVAEAEAQSEPLPVAAGEYPW